MKKLVIGILFNLLNKLTAPCDQKTTDPRRLTYEGFIESQEEEEKNKRDDWSRRVDGCTRQAELLGQHIVSMITAKGVIQPYGKVVVRDHEHYVAMVYVQHTSLWGDAWNIGWHRVKDYIYDQFAGWDQVLVTNHDQVNMIDRHTSSCKVEVFFMKKKES